MENQENRQCLVCGKSLTPNQKCFCSKECRYSLKGKEITYDALKKKWLEKYGVENVSQLKEIKEKKNKTFEEHYGCPYGQSKEVNEKCKQTIREKYGVDNVSQSETIKKKKEETFEKNYGCPYGKSKELNEKCKQRCFEKYGVENASQSEIVKQKRIETSLRMYGVENPFQSEEVKEKMKRTNLEKYGVEFISQSKEIRNKVKKTIKEKYGVENVSQSNIIKEKSITTFRNNHYESFLKSLSRKGYEPLFDKETYIKIRVGDTLSFKCRCGEIFYFTIKNQGLNVAQIYCPSQVHKNTSQYEQELFDWLTSLGVKNIEQNKRDWNGQRGIEADLYLPDYNLVIEFNGIYWHSDKNKPNEYHYDKWKFFKDQNIDCIQIFENEWWNKKDIVKSIIMNRLGLNTKIQIDRIEQIDSDSFKHFIDSNYIFDYIDSEYKFGVYHNDELVAVIGMSGNNSGYDIDLFCNKIGYDLDDCSYQYLFGKIQNKFKSDMNFAINSRYFNGKLFQNFGFKYLNHSIPKRFIFKINEYNLIEYRDDKSIIEKLNLNYNDDLSFEENLSDNKCLSIYDCGYDKFICKNK